ncbi:MAG TPA: 4'-phosphopantetheinyl transferase superfamily protein [Solirubrobacteraceae bacterium]|nr:4'-phosphopantetheinyl transferase superfamily protein [Solirubrobacteraceae bacterium]
MLWRTRAAVDQPVTTSSIERPQDDAWYDDGVAWGDPVLMPRPRQRCAFGSDLVSPLYCEEALPAGVEVYALNVGRAQWRWATTPLLSATERERASHIVVSQARARFIAARSMLRELLGARLGLAPLEVELVYNRYGKPSLNHDPTLAFNVSHSGDFVLIALRASGEVGVDVQWVDLRCDWRRIATAACSPEERSRLLEESLERGPTAFFERWVCKEAWLKALGLGLAGKLEDVVLTRERHGPGRLRLERPSGAHSIHQLRLPAGYVAALALPNC